MFKLVLGFVLLLLATSRKLTTEDAPMIAQVWFLNNGGEILSDNEDWITWHIALHDSGILACGQYVVKPGDLIQYDQLTLPIQDGDYMILTLKQRNLVGKNDSISIMT